MSTIVICFESLFLRMSLRICVGCGGSHLSSQPLGHSDRRMAAKYSVWSFSFFFFPFKKITAVEFTPTVPASIQSTLDCCPPMLFETPTLLPAFLESLCFHSLCDLMSFIRAIRVSWVSRYLLEPDGLGQWHTQLARPRIHVYESLAGRTGPVSYLMF